jgi:hypothetical protein
VIGHGEEKDGLKKKIEKGKIKKEEEKIQIREPKGSRDRPAAPVGWQRPQGRVNPNREPRTKSHLNQAMKDYTGVRCTHACQRKWRRRQRRLRTEIHEPTPAVEWRRLRHGR